MADEPYQSLYRRYRPQRFAEVRGQDHVTRALRNAVAMGRQGHAYLFSGPRGTGKTSTARILAAALNCANPVDGEPDGVCDSCLAIRAGSSLDVLELDAASNNGVDAMRDLVSRAALGSPGRWKVYIVDEVHMLSPAASNALLKTLEEPPAHVIFVLATTDDQKVLPTIRSRTQHFQFRLLTPEVLGSLLADVNDAADLGLDPASIDRVVRRGAGSARDALSALDQAAAAGVAEDENDVVPAIIEALIARDSGAALVAVAEAARRGRDAERVAVEVVEHLREAFLLSAAPGVSGVPADQRAALEDQAKRMGTAAMVRAMEFLGETLVAMRESLDTRITLELALVRLSAPAADASPAALLERIEILERRLASGGGPAAGSAGPPAGSAAAPAQRGAPSAGPPQRGATSADSSSRSADSGSAESGPRGTAVAAAGPKPTLGAMRQRDAERTEAQPPPQTGSAATAPGPTASVAPAAGALTLDRDELTKVWGDTVFPRLDSGVRAHYRHGRWVATEGETGVFLLPAVYLDRADAKRRDVEAALSEAFGGRVRVRLDVEPGGSPPRADVAARVESAAPRRSTSKDAPPADDQTDIGVDITRAEFEQLQSAPDAPNSAEARVMRAFPGTEELN